MKKYFLILIAAFGLAMTSCDTSSNNGEYTISQDIQGCFVTSQNIADGTIENTGDVRYIVKINYTRGTIDLTIYNMKLPDGSTIAQMTFADMTGESDKEGWIKVAKASVVPQIGNTAANHTIEDFRLSLLQRVMNGAYAPALNVSYTLDGKYNIFSAPCAQIFGGTTVTTGSDEPFQSKTTLYGFVYNPAKSTVDISIGYAQFISTMPRMNFDLKAIPADMRPGIIRYNIDEIIPSMNNTPQERFPISNLSGSIVYNTGFDISFRCKPGLPQLAGTTFSSTAHGTYFDMPESN